ncbi:radical SAM family heme chaperone HemW [Cellulomonas fengjieae]|uniref:Heme chaperone HemW n=1 Tax=Cellulomonas fengjieae TaxID=2819978 RepID=A0ABS3SE28_9CELL|nr:radical SAM family heme chaperone HemW [Cellulomonas fengjieae]MBO3083992.1 coproporphyrinogen III oxidase [Cellulomonas fengjieae]QVI64742.1 coproporphyrinogen III oxidase [Cellulomonas fengjieae]
MAALPDGDAAPDDGRLPGSVRAGVAERAFGVYLHVPFCRVRCGYCDFNTYTATELGGGANQHAYADTALREIALAADVLADLPRRPVSTVFVGGGTPTVLSVPDLARMLGGVRDAWGFADDVEVTTEANPDSVTPQSLQALADAGFTRVSFGMQSAVPHVLATLDRTHDPRRIPDVVRWAREAGLAVSLDLIYGTPGESLDDWRTSVEAALATGVDHVSAYALVVEPGTRMAVQVRRGELELPDGDDQAAKYELADDLFEAAGLHWYEVSNWARTPADACRHNLAYWRGDDWWGVGPGAHSHVGGVRWWNVKHPRAYADRLDRGLSPAAGRETVSGEGAVLERLMLGLRLAGGLALDDLPVRARPAVAGLVADELVDGRAAIGGRVVLTRRGRLLADAVVRDLAG